MFKPVFTALLLLLCGCARDAAPTLKLATNVWPGYELFYLAEALGEYRQVPVKLVQLVSNSQSMQAYRNGLVDAAALTLDEVLQLLDSGESPVIVHVVNMSLGGDAIVGRPALQGMADLAGKRIGVESRALGAYIFFRALEMHGLAAADSTVVTMEVQEHLDAYHSGRVDAVVTFEPVKSQLLAAGARVLWDSSMIPEEVVDVLVVRPEYLQAHPEVVRTLLHGWYQAVEYMQAQPRAAGVQLGQRLQLAPDEALAAFKGLQLPDRATNRRLVSGELPDLMEPARGMAEVMRYLGLLEHELDLRPLFVREAYQ